MTLTYRSPERDSWRSQPVDLRRFANPAVVCEGWYNVGAARAFRRGAVKRAWIGKRDIVVYREHSGALRALDRACPHLGADLTQGKVVDDGLQCAFHQWCWAPNGSCSRGGGVAVDARIRTYEVRERWGLVWVWAGGTPAYELPQPEPVNRARVLRLPAQRLDCHAHLVLGNGLDLSHVSPVHGFHLEADPVVEPELSHRLSVTAQVRFDATPMRRLLGLARSSARWRFTTIGPSLAWVRVTSPEPFELLWAARPLPGGGCATQTVFFLPRWTALIRALPMMITTTWDDRRILNALDFRPNFVASDALLARYAELVEDIAEWPPANRR